MKSNAFQAAQVEIGYLERPLVEGWTIDTILHKKNLISTIWKRNIYNFYNFIFKLFFFVYDFCCGK